MQKKPFNALLVLKIIAVLAAVVSSVLTARGVSDFDVFLDAARKLSEGRNIYAPPFLNGLNYYYSVFFALILIPVSGAPVIAKTVWLILSYAMLYRSWRITERYFGYPVLTSAQARTWMLVTVTLAVQFILYNISMVQVTIFLLWSMLEAMDRVDRGQYLSGGLLLGLAINIKLMPLLLLPYLFYRGHFKALGSAVGTFGGLLFVPSVFIGVAQNQFLLWEWWSVINPANKEHLFETGNGPHSLVSLVPVYLTGTVGDLPYHRNLLNLTHQQVEVTTNVIRLLILGLSLVYLRSRPFVQLRDRSRTFWEIAYFMLIIPLLFPHQQKYAFLLVIPMVGHVVHFFVATWPAARTTGYRIVFVSFCAAMLFYSPLYGSDLLGRHLFDITQHYRLLTLATLVVIPVSMYCSPWRLSRMLEGARQD